jgi:hypothetical protein
MALSPDKRDALSSAIGGAPARLKEDLNASLGAVSAFFGLVALLFALPLVVFMAAPFPLAVVLSAVVAGCAVLSIFVARRAPRVTKRNLGLAKAGSLASVLALGACLVVLLVTGSRALR